MVKMKEFSGQGGAWPPLPMPAYALDYSALSKIDFDEPDRLQLQVCVYTYDITQASGFFAFIVRSGTCHANAPLRVS